MTTRHWKPVFQSMKVAVIGATGLVGACLIAEVLVSTDEVFIVAMVDNEDEMKEVIDQMAKEFNCKTEELETDPRLEIIKVDVFNEEAVAKHLEDVNVVANCLEFDITGPSTKHMESSTAILKAMLRHKQCRRYIGTHSWYTDPDSRSQANFLTRPILSFYSGILDDQRNVELMLINKDWVKDICWTIVCIPNASDEDPSEDGCVAYENCCQIPGKFKNIPGPDISNLIMKVVKRGKYQNKIIAVARD